MINCWSRHATLFDLFVFIVQYEDMSRRIHCLHCWLVDVDWMHLEVGLKWDCWLCAEIYFGSFRSKSVEKLPNFPPAGLEPMPHVMINQCQVTGHFKFGCEKGFAVITFYSYKFDHFVSQKLVFLHQSLV